MAETESKERANKPLIIKTSLITTFALLIATLVLPLLIDLILVSLYVPPVFARIASEDINDGEYTVGHGILYTVIWTRMEFGGDRHEGYDFAFGYHGWDEEKIIESRWVYADGTIVKQTDSKESVTSPPSSGSNEEAELEDPGISLDLDLARELADGSVSPIDFMAKYPAHTVKDDDKWLYQLLLQDNYAIQIQYTTDDSGAVDTVDFVYLLDITLEAKLDLQSQQIDLFIAERE
ncbi:hypothetical protein FACS1894219_12260 [Clostridia bacterium]|nr:hypothetical protein FACS1894219_12260 [Clostridia bacterium]